MKYAVKINSVKTIDELPEAWNHDDFAELLKRFDYPDADKIKEQEVQEYLFMAIADFEPQEAAAILLDYKLSEVLAPGQIDNISHEMLRQKVAENYSDITLHKALFNINQLLYKAYNGKFPLTKAVVTDFEIREEGGEGTEVSKELILKALSPGLSESSLLNRLFKEQLEGAAEFSEAEGIIWELNSKGNHQYQMVTSEKWITEEDFKIMEFESEVAPMAENSQEE